MPTIIKWLFSPIGVVITMGIGIGIFIPVVRKILHSGNHVVIKIILCVAVLILVAIISANVFMSDFSKPSEVDISPLEQTTVKTFYEAEEMKDFFEKLECRNGVVEFWSRISSEEDLLLYNVAGSCSYHMYNRDIPAEVYVSIDIYDSPDNACECMSRIVSRNKWKRQTVKISENIDVILLYSTMYRSADQFFPYNDNRSVETYVRIGNIVIDFMENGDEVREIGVLTSKNIALICEILGD